MLYAAFVFARFLTLSILLQILHIFFNNSHNFPDSLVQTIDWACHRSIQLQQTNSTATGQSLIKPARYRSRYCLLSLIGST